MTYNDSTYWSLFIICLSVTFLRVICVPNKTRLVLRAGVKGSGDRLFPNWSEKEMASMSGVTTSIIHWIWYLLSYPFSNNVEVQSLTECHGMIWRRLCGCFPSPIFSVPFSVVFILILYSFILHLCIYRDRLLTDSKHKGRTLSLSSFWSHFNITFLSHFCFPSPRIVDSQTNCNLASRPRFVAATDCLRVPHSLCLSVFALSFFVWWQL